MKIRIFYEKTNFRFKGWRRAVILFDKLLRSEGMIPGEINFIITTDNIIKALNKKFLNHNYNTDVIAFESNSGNTVNGEVYVSKDTVKRNAYNYNVSLHNEIIRVMIHGLLHLSGYDDKTSEEKNSMHKVEDYWIREFYNTNDGIQV